MRIKTFSILALIIFTSVVILSRWLPWPVVILLIPGTIIGLVLWAKMLVVGWWNRSISIGFDRAGRVLKGAEVTIHNVAVVDKPPDFVDDYEAEEDLDEEDYDAEEFEIDRYIAINMMVAPDPNALKDVVEEGDDENNETFSTGWNPTNFTLVDFEAQVDSNKLELFGRMFEIQGTVCNVELIDQNGSNITCDTDCEVGEIEGDQMIRATFGIPKGLPKRVKLRYVTEEFSDIILPA